MMRYISCCYHLAKMTNPSSISNPCEGKTGSIITMKPRLEKKRPEDKLAHILMEVDCPVQSVI